MPAPGGTGNDLADRMVHVRLAMLPLAVLTVTAALLVGVLT
ncbi:hypothetical protein [Streptomyces collinus]